MKDKELLRAIDIHNELCDDMGVKMYCDALHKIFDFIDSDKNKPKTEYIASSKKWHYYLELPYEELTIIGNGKYDFKHRGYNIVGKRNRKDKYFALSCCMSYCNKTREDAIKVIKEHIEEDNLQNGSDSQ